jgi:Na+:H+ antiporter, NhaC family
MDTEHNFEEHSTTTAEAARPLPSFGYSVFTLLLIVAILVGGAVFFGASIQVMMFASLIAAIPLVMRIGYSFDEVTVFAADNVMKVFQVILILFAVGTLIAAWMQSGTIATLTYAGLSIINAPFFLLTALVLCIIASLATGTSFGTVSTVGIAMMGIGAGLGMPPGLTAGAVVCGAFFGDKMSPLSDSTNLAPAVAGTDIISHIKHMMWTTVPSILITAVVFTLIGFNYAQGAVDAGRIETITSALDNTFELGLVPLIPVVVTLTLLLFRKPAFPSIFLGALTGAGVAVVYQGVPVSDALSVMYEGYESSVGVGAVDELLSGGGIVGIAALVALVIFAVGLAGILLDSGILSSILRPLLPKLSTERRVVVSTIPITYLALMVGTVHSLALVLGGTIMAPLYRKFRLEPQNLSRTLEDCATTGAPIVPWSSTAIFVSGALGVSTLTYAPFTFFSFLCPIFALIYGLTGFTITKYDDAETTDGRNGKPGADLDKDANIFRGMLVKSDGRTYIRCPEGRFNLAAPDTATCAPDSPAALVVRPERLRLTSPDSAPEPDENAISATVRDVMDRDGERQYVLVTAANDELICRHKVGASAMQSRPGDEVIGCWKVQDGAVVPAGSEN